MTTTGLRTFDHSLATTQDWLSDVKEEMHLDDSQTAMEVARAVLHTLRDRLTIEQAAYFAAQLPMLLQGLYYHEWTPKGKPEKIRSRDEFLARISDKLLDRFDPAVAAEAVFRVVQRRMSAGEVDDVKSMLPAEIRSLWPAS